MRHQRVLVFGLLVAVAASWARALASRTLAVDAAPSLLLRWLACAVAALGLASVAWVSTRAVAEGAPLRLGHALGLALLAAAALPLTSNDVFSNLAYGRLGVLGLNPYLVTPDALLSGDSFAVLVGARWKDTPLAYGPVLAALNIACARAGSVLAALVAWKVVLAASVCATIALAARFSRGDQSSGPSRFAIVALSPAFLWEIAAQAHNDGVMVLALTGFVVAAFEEHAVVAVVCLAIGVYAKLAVAPVLAFYLVVVGRARPGFALVLLALALALGAACFAPFWHGWSSLRGPAATVGADVIRTSRSLADLVVMIATPVSATAARVAYRTLWCASAIAVVVTVVRGLWRARTLADVIHHGFLVVLIYDLTTPWFQPWYVTWLLPLAMAHADQRHRRLGALYAALVPLQYVGPLDPVSSVAIDAFVAWKLVRLRADVETANRC